MKITVALIALLGLCVSAHAADKTPSTELRGSVADANLMKHAPTNGVIASAKAFEKLCKAWKIDMPKVDFTKEIVLVGTTSGSLINGRPSLMDGNLKMLFLATADFGEGFRYLMIIHPRADVKTVNGKELPKE